MLKISYSEGLTEAGCDEAGRGCLAGPVFAACVMLPPGYEHPLINDSKMLSVSRRDTLRKVIEEESVAWSVGVADSREIDEMNILNASFLAMHRAIKGLAIKPDLLLVDGNRFRPFPEIPHICIVKGDSKFQSVAAASILAKTHRDEYMVGLHRKYPAYNWLKNKGYPTREHLAAIRETGLSPLHRRSFRQGEQLKIFFRTL